MKSWKTTLSGALAAAGAGMAASSDSTIHLIGVILAAFGTALIGFFARDNNKSSEAVGAK